MTNSTNSTISDVIRDLRKRKKMTVRQLAARIDRSIGFISQIERGLSEPTVEDLTAIGNALGVPSEIFAEPAQQATPEWKTIPGSRRSLKYARGVTDFIISPNLSGNMVMLETVLEPGADFGEKSITENAEQAGYVLEGELTLWIDGEEVLIAAEEGFQIPGGIPCRYANKGNCITKVIWVYN